MPNEAPAITGTPSHFVTVNGRNSGGPKEEVYILCAASWRGRPVVVSMQADRYTASQWNNDTNERLPDALTPWRVYATEAREAPSDGDSVRGGPHLTDTAKHRLSDECRPLVVDWLASEAYEPSEKGAYASALRRLAQDMDRHGRPPSRDLRLALASFAAKLTPAASARLLRIADAWDAYVAVLHSAE